MGGWANDRWMCGMGGRETEIGAGVFGCRDEAAGIYQRVEGSLCGDFMAGEFRRIDSERVENNLQTIY